MVGWAGREIPTVDAMMAAHGRSSTWNRARTAGYGWQRTGSLATILDVKSPLLCSGVTQHLDASQMLE